MIKQILCVRGDNLVSIEVAAKRLKLVYTKTLDEMVAHIKKHKVTSQEQNIQFTCVSINFFVGTNKLT